MKHLLLAGALALAASLGGRAEFDNAINGAVAFVDAPKTQQALSSLQSGATAFTCAVANVAAIASEIESGEVLLGFGNAPGAKLNLSAKGDLREAAANLFAMLRELDKVASQIAVSPIPDTSIGEAINDRLRRAAAPR